MSLSTWPVELIENFMSFLREEEEIVTILLSYPDKGSLAACSLVARR
jgi:hypothetical protein